MNEQQLFSEYKYIIAACPLFKDIPQELLTDSLAFLKAQFKTYKKGDHIVMLGEPFRYGILLLDGSLEGSFINENYDKINMNHFSEGALIGESLACAEIKCSPIQLRAMTEVKVLLLDFMVLYDTEAVKHTYQLKLSVNLIKALSKQNVFISTKIRIFGQKALRDKVIVYLESLPKRKDGSVKIPFTQTALAEFMGVNRSALSRELGRMEDEGLLKSVSDGYILKL